MSVFLIVGFVGLALLLVSLVLGDMVDGFSTGSFDALSSDVFSTAVIGAFVSALGFGGAIAERPGRPWCVAPADRARLRACSSARSPPGSPGSSRGAAATPPPPPTTWWAATGPC